MKLQWIIIVGLALLIGLAYSSSSTAQPADAEDQAQPKLETVRDQASYVIGMNIGKQFKAEGLDIDPDLLALGVRDMLAGKEPRLAEQQIQTVMMAFRQETAARQAQMARGNTEKGVAFLDDNSTREGVHTLPSGLQYKVIEQGDGPSPTLNDSFRAHYRGTLIDGTEFDSSYKRGEPSVFPVSGVIPGWTEALQLMKVGDKWQLFIPSDLAYGPQSRPPHIRPNAVLIFDIELLGIE